VGFPSKMLLLWCIKGIPCASLYLSVRLNGIVVYGNGNNCTVCLQQMKEECKLWTKARCSFFWIHTNVTPMQCQNSGSPYRGSLQRCVYASCTVNISLVSFESVLHYNKMGSKFFSYDRHNTCGVIRDVISCKDFPVVTYWIYLLHYSWM